MAQLITWTDDLSVGVQELDDQHKILIDMLNSLAEAIQAGKSRELRIAVFNKLLEYTKVHLTVEEGMLRIAQYPKFDEHKKEHESLVAQVLEFREKLATGEAHASAELLMFLRRWLTDHIMKSDKAYEKHLLKMGAKRSWIQRTLLDKFWSR